MLNWVSRNLTKILYPARCVACDRVLTITESGVCTDCLGKLSVITNGICISCGRQLNSHDKILCSGCEELHHNFDGGRILYTYSSAKESLYRFKYGGRAEYADFYADELEFFLGDYISGLKADLLIPVPLHKDRMKSRGYNQAELIAKALAKRLNIPFSNKMVERSKNTLPLKTMRREERQNNLKNAFIMRGNDVKSKCVIIIDDIYTTGATIDEIAGLLKKAGVRKVFFLAIASAAGAS